MTDDLTQDILDAQEMLGKGYPSIELHPQTSVVRRRGKQMTEEVVPAFVKIMTTFKAELGEIDGNALKVWLFIALSVNRYTDEAHPGIRTIAKVLNMGQNTVISHIKELERTGYLQVRRGEKRYNIYKIPDFVSATASKTEAIASENAQNASENAPTASEERENLVLNQIYNQRNQSNQSDFFPSKKKNKLSEETKTAIEQNPQWAMLAGNDNQAAAVAQKQAAAKEHLDNFERIFGFNPLPWGTTPKWKRLQRFLEGKTERDFKEYVRWRENEGKYESLSNKQIYDDPDKLVATWPERRSSESIPKYVPPDDTKYTEMPEDMLEEFKRKMRKGKQDGR